MPCPFIIQFFSSISDLFLWIKILESTFKNYRTVVEYEQFSATEKRTCATGIS